MKKPIIYIILTLTLLCRIKSQTDFYAINNINEIHLHFRESNWDKILDSLFTEGKQERLKASLYINGYEYDDVGVRYKGFSSVDTSYSKNPLNIDIDYIHNNQSFLGIKKLKLGNVIHDPSFVREVLSYEIAGKYMPASKANYAKVFINNSYYGLFTNVEPVNQSFALKHFSSGHRALFKGAPKILEFPFGSNANLQFYDNNISSYFPYYSQESQSGWEDLVKLIRILNTVPDSIESILNVDRTLWMHAFNYSLLNLDSYIAYAQNYYLYRDDNGRFNPIIWDLNMSFGSFRHSDGSLGGLTGGLSINAIKNLNPLGLLNYSISPRPLFNELMKDDTRRKMYLAHIRTIIKENFISGEYLVRGNELQSIIDSCVYYDFNKFYLYNDFKDNLTVTTGGSGGIIQYPGIQDLVEARINYLSTYKGFSGEPLIENINCSEIDNKGEIHINAFIEKADTCILAYRFSNKEIFRKIQMKDDGNNNDNNAGDGIYGAKIKAEGGETEFYIYAENDSAGTFSPERAEYEYYKVKTAVMRGELVINELLVINQSGEEDECGDKTAWLELFNNTSYIINTGKLFLSDNRNNIKKWNLPNYDINPFSYAIIFPDSDTAKDNMHANFSVSPVSGNIYLSYSDSYTIDSLSYHQQITDISYGRFPNGTGDFKHMPPSYSNVNISDTIGSNILVSGIIRLFPNPAEDYVNVIIPNKQNGTVNIKINNIKGQNVFSCNYTNNYGIFISEQLDISDLTSGFYYISINTGNIIYKSKLIKQ